MGQGGYGIPQFHPVPSLEKRWGKVFLIKTGSDWDEPVSNSPSFHPYTFMGREREVKKKIQKIIKSICFRWLAFWHLCCFQINLQNDFLKIIFEQKYLLFSHYTKLILKTKLNRANL